MLEKIDGTFKILQSDSFGTVMGIGDKSVDIGFMVSQEWMDIRLVNKAGPLSLREDKIREEEEAKIGIERDPGDDEEGPVFNEGEAGNDDPIHQPWCQLRWVGGTKGFVRGEDGEQNGDDGARKQSAAFACLFNNERWRSSQLEALWGIQTYERRLGMMSNMVAEPGVALQS